MAAIKRRALLNEEADLPFEGPCDCPACTGRIWKDRRDVLRDYCMPVERVGEGRPRLWWLRVVALGVVLGVALGLARVCWLG
jgi:hypothetical protein